MCNVSAVLLLWLLGLWKKEGSVPEMKEFLKLRSNKDDYKTFMKVFVREVVGRRLFDGRLRNGSADFDKLATRTDEAFALLVVENSEGYWRELLTRHNGDVPIVKRGEERPESLQTNIEPKYTKGEEVLGQGMEAARKWNNDGINRFNELLKMVGDDREAHPSFVVNLINEERMALENKRKRKREITLEPIVLAHNDLGGSDSEQSETERLSNEGETEEEESDQDNDSDSDNESFERNVNRSESV